MTASATIAGRRVAEPDEATTRRAKAEYALMEAMRCQAVDSTDAYVDLLQYAYNTDTSLTAAAFHLGLAMMGAEGQDRAYYLRAIELMRKHFVAHPDDYNETMIYGDLCVMLGMPEQSLASARALAAMHPNKFEVMARLARAYTLNYEFAHSNVVYDSIEMIHGRSQGITDRKIANFIALRDTAAAIAEQHSLLMTAPDNVDFILETANTYYQLGRRDSALSYLHRAHDIAPDDGNVYAAIGLYYRAIGDSVAFFENTYKALMTDNLELEQKEQLLIGVARHFYTPGDTSVRAARLFEALIEKHPHEVSFHKAYADYLAACSHYSEAGEQLSYALDMEPTDIDNWHRLMLIHLLEEDYPAAISASERAIEYNSDDPTIYSYVGQANFQMKRYNEAITAYTRAIELTDSLDTEEISDLLGAMGDAYCAMGDTVTAYARYEHSLELNPDNAGILNNYAYMLSLQGAQLDRAEAMVKRALMITPGSATFLDTYAWVLYRKGEYAAALEQQQAAMQAIQGDPGDEMLQHLDAIKQALSQEQPGEDSTRVDVNVGGVPER